MLAANTTGGVVGKMISPQSLAIAATSVDMEGKESDILKAVLLVLRYAPVRLRPGLPADQRAVLHDSLI